MGSTSATLSGGAFSVEITESRPGLLIFYVEGPGAEAAFAREGGGHRWQRKPPNSKQDKVHTSTITVAALREPTEAEVRLAPADVAIQATRGSGPGGQARNKTESAIIATHKPTGISVRCDTTRSQQQNRTLALAMLRARILAQREAALTSGENAARRAQVGSGMRGDKIRTYRTQDDVVTDHRTGQKWRLRDFLRGDF